MARLSRLLFAAAAFAALCLTAAPVKADVLFLQPLSPDLADLGAYSESDQIVGQQLADNFSLGQPVIVNQVQWFGSYIGRSQPAGTQFNFTIRFFHNAAGLPASSPFYEVSVTATATLLPDGLRYQFDTDLAAPLALGAGSYWLSIVESDPTTEPFSWVWNNSLYTSTDYIARTGPGGAWFQVLPGSRGNTAFVLLGTPVAAEVPEPATLFLLGTGLAGLSAIIRKRTRR